MEVVPKRQAALAELAARGCSPNTPVSVLRNQQHNGCGVSNCCAWGAGGKNLLADQQRGGPVPGQSTGTRDVAE